MDFSNRHTNEFVYACDLERVLGGVSVCHEGIAGAGVSGVDTRSAYQAGEHNNTAVVNGVNEAIFDCTGGNAGRIADSELLLRKSLKNIVIPDYGPESEVGACANTNALCHCEERSDVAIHSCHAELVSASYQREMDKFSVNHDNGIFPPVQSKIASLRNGGIVMLRLPKPCTSASLFRLHIGSRDGGVK